MRPYGIVYTTFWTSETTHSMTDDGKLLAAYLLTGPHTTALGCFRLPDGYVMEDLSWSMERVKKAFRELSSKGFANRCETTKWVLVLTFLEWNPPENPNQRKQLRRLADQVPQQFTLRKEIEALISECFGPAEQLNLIDEGKANTVNGSGTVEQPFLNQEQEQEQEQIHIKEHIEPCSERQSAPTHSPIVSRLPLVDGSVHHVRDADVEKWGHQYPAVDVKVELGKMLGWLEANPRNRKTPRGILGFIHRWLAGAQDKAPRVGAGNAQQQAGTSAQAGRVNRGRERLANAARTVAAGIAGTDRAERGPDTSGDAPRTHGRTGGVVDGKTIEVPGRSD